MEACAGASMEKLIEYGMWPLAAVIIDRWPDDVRLSDLEPRFIRKACGKRGADARPPLFDDTRAPSRQAIA